MKTLKRLLGLSIVISFLSLYLTASNERPNIVLIMVDDMGWSDVGSYGGEIPTPHIDSLAANGVRFSQFYNTARCYPTRASLLTGLHPHQTGIGAATNSPRGLIGDHGVYGYRGYLNRNSLTLAEVLGSYSSTQLTHPSIWPFKIPATM
ncbi:sulfatase-like hydrolase/transferase [Opitutia bacterium ISCC 51]|nr:sulfatase-like hydrolase/transferase [Opitutae bacterium ISCC 51]QXD26477.1 sulfatase-like hydrolase/transferase [Opitutae bacterium ISCC 52]